MILHHNFTTRMKIYIYTFYSLMYFILGLPPCCFLDYDLDRLS